MRHKIFCTLLMWMLWVSPFSALCARNVAASKESIKEKLSSEFFENLYSKTYSRPVDRGDLICVGKTVIAAHDHYSYRETPANLLDGLSGNIWAAFGGNPAWAIIDLEQERCNPFPFARP